MIRGGIRHRLEGRARKRMGISALDMETKRNSSFSFYFSSPSSYSFFSFFFFFKFIFFPSFLVPLRLASLIDIGRRAVCVAAWVRPARAVGRDSAPFRIRLAGLPANQVGRWKSSEFESEDERAAVSSSRSSRSIRNPCPGALAHANSQQSGGCGSDRGRFRFQSQ